MGTFLLTTHVYNQLNDFPEYVNKSASNAKITNFCRLEPVFRRLGLRFDSKIAFEIIKSTRTPWTWLQAKNVLDKISSKASAVVGRPRQDVNIFNLAPPLLTLSDTGTSFNLRLLATQGSSFDKHAAETYSWYLRPAQHELFEKSIRMYIKGRTKSIWQSTSRSSPTFSKISGNIRRYRCTSAFFAEKDMIRQQRRQNLQREHEFLRLAREGHRRVGIQSTNWRNAKIIREGWRKRKGRQESPKLRPAGLERGSSRWTRKVWTNLARRRAAQSKESGSTGGVIDVHEVTQARTIQLRGHI